MRGEEGKRRPGFHCSNSLVIQWAKGRSFNHCPLGKGEGRYFEKEVKGVKRESRQEGEKTVPIKDLRVSCSVRTHSEPSQERDRSFSPGKKGEGRHISFRCGRERRKEV